MSVTSIMMMTSQILKSVDFTKTHKSKYLENKTFFLHIKKFMNGASKKSSFAAEEKKNALKANLFLWLRYPFF